MRACGLGFRVRHTWRVSWVTLCDAVCRDRRNWVPIRSTEKRVSSRGAHKCCPGLDVRRCTSPVFFPFFRSTENTVSSLVHKCEARSRTPTRTPIRTTIRDSMCTENTVSSLVHECCAGLDARRCTWRVSGHVVQGLGFGVQGLGFSSG
jgi:hypothetical protein